MATHAVTVRVFAAPDVSCGHGPTWSATTSFMGARLRRRFGDLAEVEHLEIFTGSAFEFPAVLATIQGGSSLPIVVVDGRIVSEGGKLAEPAIARAVAEDLDGMKTREDEPHGEH